MLGRSFVDLVCFRLGFKNQAGLSEEGEWPETTVGTPQDAPTRPYGSLREAISDDRPYRDTAPCRTPMPDSEFKLSGERLAASFWSTGETFNTTLVRS